MPRSAAADSGSEGPSVVGGGVGGVRTRAREDKKQHRRDCHLLEKVDVRRRRPMKRRTSTLKGALKCSWRCLLGKGKGRDEPLRSPYSSAGTPVQSGDELSSTMGTRLNLSDIRWDS